MIFPNRGKMACRYTVVLQLRCLEEWETASLDGSGALELAGLVYSAQKF